MADKVSYGVLLYLSLAHSFDMFGADFDMSFMNFVLIEFIGEADKEIGLSILIWLNRSNR